ncbi:MAG: TRAP transporter permease, partial [Vicinamibacterales bacterium]
VAGFLLGTVSGSGVATTVTLGSVAWPVLRRAGYSAETGGAMLSAAGIGALLSPPTLGAAAFLIAEFLQISYLQVLVMATVPTLLYYLSIFLMVEADSSKAAAVRQAGGPGEDQGARPGASGIDPLPSAGAMALRYWYHFTSLLAIAVFMVAGMSAFRAVFWATLVAVALSYVRRETALTAPRLFDALRAGGQDVLAVAATTATAGIIVGIVTLTGLGLEIAGVIVALAGGTLVLTAIYSAIAVWLLGLAVPVTASYIIAAVMVAPALVTAGVSAIAAHMFIFYYAVLSEVSPPTALSPFAAAALTGGNPFRTMVQTWKYTLPAFLVPFVFTTGPDGAGVLLQGALKTSLVATVSAIGGIAAIAIAGGGWMKGRVHPAARIALASSAAVLLWGSLHWRLAAATSAVVVLILHFTGRSPRGEPVGGG